MYDTNDDSEPTAEEQRSNFGPSGHHEPLADDLEAAVGIEDATEQQEIGLLAGLVDGHFVCVNWRDFMVTRTDTGDVEVSREGVVLGGRYGLTSENFSGLLVWLENKHAQYGEVAA